MNNDDERDYAEEAYNRAEYFENYDEPDNLRILTDVEFSAIRAFALKWGYSHSERFSDDLVGLLEDTQSTESDIEAFLDRWVNSSDPDMQEMFENLLDMLKLRNPTDSADEPIGTAELGESITIW